MPLFDDVDDQYLKTRELYKHWHRNDFISHLVHASTGGPQQGVSGDSLLAQGLWQRNATNVQLQRAADQTRIGTSKIQGVPIATTVPTNGQVLVFNSGQGQYVPETPTATHSSTLLAGSGGDRSAISISPIASLLICSSGNTVVIGSRSQVEILIPYNATAQNLTLKVTGNASGATNLTLTLYKNGVATVLTQTIIGVAGPFTVEFQDLTDTVSILANDRIFLQLDTSTNPATVIIEGFSMELIHG